MKTHTPDNANRGVRGEQFRQLEKANLISRQAQMKAHKDHKRINWDSTLFLILFHLGAIAALFMFSWSGLTVALILAWLAGGLGVGMGYHRLFTHRGYKTPKLVEYFLTFCGMLSPEGGAINWVVTHRIHHQHTEEPGKDPHTPREGKWWSHIGWILRGTAQQHSESVMRQYAPDLYKDPCTYFLTASTTCRS